MKNNQSSEGLAEDLIRSFTQIACVELHTKTLIEKYNSKLSNGLFDNDEEMQELTYKVDDLKEDLIELAEMRRNDMRYLVKLFDKSNLDYWCIVKHKAIAMYTSFEAYQASNDDAELYIYFLEKNKTFIKSLTMFLGIEITDCASCFSDFLKRKEVV